jgi:hypothetical protein
MSAGEDEKRALLEQTDRLVRLSHCPDEDRVAVLMLAAVLAIRRMASVSRGQVRRGKVVNAATEDFRKKLQRFL